ncbi:MAG: acyl carrier protein [Armatimonadota bacterium]|nr:acyl carrier protein [Armatimonadota bacterium]
MADLEGWDSLTVIGFMALVDEQFGLTVPANRIAEATTVDDLIRLVGARVETG